MLAALKARTSRFGLEHLLHSSIVGLGRGNDLRQVLSFYEQLDFGCVEHFALDQSFCDSLQNVAIVGDDLLCRRIASVDQLADLLVNLNGRVSAVVAVLRNLAAQEYLLLFFAESQRAKIAHAPL